MAVLSFRKMSFSLCFVQRKVIGITLNGRCIIVCARYVILGRYVPNMKRLCFRWGFSSDFKNHLQLSAPVEKITIF